MIPFPLLAQIAPVTTVDDVTGSGIVGMLSNVTFFVGVLLAIGGIVMIIMKLVGGDIGGAVKTGLGILIAAALLMNLDWGIVLLNWVINIVDVALESFGGLFGGSGGGAGAAPPAGAVAPPQ